MVGMIRIAAKQPQFQAGQLVRHRRYGYRGVVVALDVRCRADEAWYRQNRTQPDRNQPWYHVLVDGTSQVTYAAESSLKADEEKAEVSHPLLDVYFEPFDGNRYVRNEKPWSGW
ncbi:MAG: heat shock protein HspQ [Planctomycetota bacterium]|nr:MAG: heat shock protein HspQ [Planctomycetota bacterium]REK29505.1 MAG: heat shock protein HspQ [Planctomycetota bacterium]REK46590.1 MAG: heat shock protein HspQ [Planctomycetota bacterium]